MLKRSEFCVSPVKNRSPAPCYKGGHLITTCGLSHKKPMKKFSTTQIMLLTCLANGQCHSGSSLGSRLSMSRTAIWKHIKQLIDLGLPIERLPQKGYRLTHPMTLLDAQTINQQVRINQFNKPINIHLYATLDSTNRVLKELPRSTAIEICCAEKQTAGRGRFGRYWYSPFGENIYCSSRWHFGCDLSRLSGLSLVVSLAIVATLNDFGISEHLRVKWPNDILWHNRKLSGSLIEVIAESNSAADVVIGIGLNVNSTTTEHDHTMRPDKPWCSLFDITGHYMDRNALIAGLLSHLNEFLTEFMLQGFNAFILRWQSIDYLHGQLITVSQPTGTLTGTAHGVNKAGQLILIDEAGIKHDLSSGDTSLHGLR